MTLELEYVINMAIGAIGSVAVYLFFRNQDHEKRIQRIEDVQSVKIDELKKDFQEMELKIDKLAQSVSDLSTNIHKSKNQENALNTTLAALLKHLETQQDKVK